LNARVAANIVAHRDEHGPFKSRKELQKVSGLGPKAFEQAAGFLRIRDGAHPLDASAVHPERYDLVDKMAADLGCTGADLLRDSSKRAKIDLTKSVTTRPAESAAVGQAPRLPGTAPAGGAPALQSSAEIGLPTLKDIIAELNKPGRDPRQQ